MKESAATQVITIANHKGGVGKTTSVRNIAAALNMIGKSVLLVDLDDQCSLSNCFSNNYEKSIYDLFVSNNLKDDISSCIYGTDNGKTKILPASVELNDVGAVLNDFDGVFKLAEMLDCVKSDFDYILIDTPPNVGKMTGNALVASDKIIIPMQADVESIEGLKSIIGMVSVAKRRCNEKLVIDGVFFTRYQSGQIASNTLKKSVSIICEEAGTKLYETSIRECAAALRKARIMEKSIFEYDAKSNAAVDYESLVKEILN